MAGAWPPSLSASLAVAGGVILNLIPFQAWAAPATTAPLELDPVDRARFQRSSLSDPIAESPNLDAAPTTTDSQPAPWAGTLELYGFLPLQTTNRTTIGGFTAETSLTLGQVLDALQSTVSLRGSLEHGRLGLLTDISYVNLQGEQVKEQQLDRIRIGDGRLLAGLGALKQRLPEGTRGREQAGARLRERLVERRQQLGEVQRQRGELAARLAAREGRGAPITRTFRTELNGEQGIYDIALRYRLGARESAVAPAGTTTVIPYAGIRLLDVALEIDSELRGRRGISRSVARSWGSPVVQPLLGTQAQVFVAPRLRLFARGDVAGFGVSGSDSFSGNAQAGVGYAVGNSTQLDISWRYLHLAANNGKDPANAYVIGQNGLELGLKFFF
ncbi:MAG: hypothetical protein ACKOZW_01470 [Cyanobium sp.]